MTALDMVLLVAIAVVMAALGQFISGASKGGCLYSIGAALVGGYAGPWVATYFGVPEPLPVTIMETTFPVVTTAAGALILVIIVNFITRGRRL